MSKQQGVSKVRILSYSLVILILILLSLHLFVSNYTQRKPVTAVERVVMDVTLTAHQVIASPIVFGRDLFDRYLDLVDVKRHNKILLSKVMALHSKNNALIEENLRYRRILYLQEYAKKLPYNFIAAKVIGHPPTEDKAIYINKGLTSGIGEGMPVVTAAGIVGKITLVSNGYSKVLLLSDPQSAISGRIQRNRIETIVSGDARGQPSLKYIQTSEDIKHRDVVVTSGLDGVYPEGIPIGYVSRINRKTETIFQDIELKPYVDLKNVEELLIIKNEIQATR